jgi:two-component system, response regulator, stage 0 sporulation protein F
MILVVDDDKDLARLLQTSLEHEGYRVETAPNGAAAYERVKAPDCKCMLLDVNMPGINGIELLLLMQAEGIRVPTILMAGFEDYNEREMKQFESVVKFVNKPFTLDSMLDVIRKHALPKRAEAHASSHHHPSGKKH